MRVIAGTKRGATLRAPRGTGTRPTSDRVREAVFSMLGDVAGADVLDLFAGSGALGIEALSRGAGACTFVDSAPAAVAAIRGNLAALGLEGQLVRRQLPGALGGVHVTGHEYDLVFLDPPYRLAAEIAPALATALPAILAPGARIVAESDRRAPLELDLPGMPLVRERRYGDTLIRIYDSHQLD